MVQLGRYRKVRHKNGVCPVIKYKLKNCLEQSNFPIRGMAVIFSRFQKLQLRFTDEDMPILPFRDFKILKVVQYASLDTENCHFDKRLTQDVYHIDCAQFTVNSR